MEDLLALIPDYAKDLRLNLPAVVKQAELTEQQAWGTVVASAIACRNPDVTEYLVAEAAAHLTPEALNGAKSAAAIMGMNNIWYRFPHLSGNAAYQEMPARLRMQVIKTHGADAVDFELWCVAASAIHGCGKCISSHEQVLRQKGMKEETVAAAVRIAAVVHGIASIL